MGKEDVTGRFVRACLWKIQNLKRILIQRVGLLPYFRIEKNKTSHRSNVER